jgi:hypothetical protein
MKTLATILVSVLCVGCAATRERAIAIAAAEITNRKLALPANYTFHVEQGFANFEFQTPYHIWAVEFWAPGAKEPLYSVWVDERNGRIDEVTDYRRHKPVRPRT